MNKIPVDLYGKQYEILQDWLNTDKHSMDIIHAGAGKTFLASIALPIFASDKKYHKGKDIIYSAPTREMIKTLIWEPLKNICINHYGLQDGRDINNSDLVIKFPNGVFIRCKSAEQKENLRGLNASIWIADEASLYNEDSLQEISNRLRPKVGQPDTEGRMIVISTPYGAGPLYKLYQVALANPDKWIVRLYNYLQMRSGNKEFIENQRKILSPLKFAQDYMCQWEAVADQFYYTWNKSMLGEVKDEGGDLYSFHDFNSKRMCAIIAKVKNIGKPNGTIEILNTYAIPNCSTEKLAGIIREDYPQRNIFAVIDATGAHNNRSTTSTYGITDRTILEKYGFTIKNQGAGNPRVSDTDNASNAFIAKGNLKVSSENKLMIEALTNYHYEDASRIKLVKYKEQDLAHIDALGDALRYGIYHLFPIVHNEIPVPDYVTSDRKYSAVPGAKYRQESPLFPGGPTLEQLIKGDEGAEDYMSY